MRHLIQRICLIFVIGLVWGLEGNEGREFKALRDETFEAAWSQVNRSYYDADFGGLDWGDVGERYREQLPKVESMDELRELISAMIYELGDSHLNLVSSDYDPEELMKAWSGGWSGVELGFAGKDVVFSRLETDGAAYRSGIRAGDRLLALDGVKVRAFRRDLKRSGLPEHIREYSLVGALASHFRTAEGDEVEVTVKSASGGRKTCVLTQDRYAGRMTLPLGRMGRLPFVFEAEMLDERVGYLRFNLWFPAVMPDIRSFVGSLPEDCEGLVIDLRGNPGGVMVMAGGLAGLLLDEQQSLGRTALREGYMNVMGFPQKGAFLGKVAILVDETSVSTSEVFAIGMQELGRARVFGQPTPGAALPSVIQALPNGDSLQVALGDFKTPQGVSLEARGVMPDEVVLISPIDISKNKDRVLFSALEWIQQPK